jgi:hypothetical protein
MERIMKKGLGWSGRGVVKFFAYVYFVLQGLLLVGQAQAVIVENSIVDSQNTTTSFAGERFSAGTSDNYRGAQSFTMRGTPANLSTVTVMVQNFAVGDSTANIALWSDNSGQPGSLIEDLGNITVTGTAEQDRIVYSAGNGAALSTDTTYWIVVTWVSGAFDWMISNESEDNFDVVADMGYNDVLWRNDTPQWSQPTLQTFRMRVVAEFDTAPTFSIGTAGFDLTPEGAPGSIAFYPFYVLRNGFDLGTATVDYSVMGSGTYPDVPASADDFYQGNFPTGTVTFANRETQKRIDILYSGDRVVEADETYTVTISNPSTGTLGAYSIGGTIPNDDYATISLISNGSVTEGNSGSTSASLTLRINQVQAVPSFTPTIDQDTYFDIYTAGDSATPGIDFEEVFGGMVVLSAGQTSTNFTVNVFGDTTFEGNEAFIVEAYPNSPYYMNGLSMVNYDVPVLILNDDPQPGRIVMVTPDGVEPGDFSMSWSNDGTNTYRLEFATQLFPTSNWQEVTGLTNTSITVAKEAVIGTNLYYRLLQNP